MDINCSSTESPLLYHLLVKVVALSSGIHLALWRYVTNPDATANCQYCSARTTDQWMVQNSIFFTQIVGETLGYSGLYYINVRHQCCYCLSIPHAFLEQTICVYVFTYLIRVQSHRRLIAFSKRSVSSFIDVFKVSKSDIEFSKGDIET